MKPFNRLVFSVPLLAVSLLSVALPTFGASPHDLEEIIITASQHDKTESEIAGSLNVIDSKELERAAASTLGETLKNQLGVQSASFGTGVGLPVIRGQSGSRVEVLQNNLNVGDASDVSADHATGTDAFLADRIEILRGPSTLRYGSGAIGGVVNVIDNRIHSNYVEGVNGSASAQYNENNQSRSVAAKLDIGAEDWMLHFDGTARSNENTSIPGLANEEVDDPDETTDGFIGNSDGEAESFAIGLSNIGAWGSAGFSIAQINNNYGIPPGAHGDEEEEEGHNDEEEEGEEEEEESVRIDLAQTTYQASALLNVGNGFFDHVDLDLSYTDYEHDEIEFESPTSEGDVETTFNVSTIAFRAEAAHNETQNWLGAFGLSFVSEDLEAVGEEAFVPPSSADRLGFYIIEETTIGIGTVELGARIERQEIDALVLPGDLSHTSFSTNLSYILPVGDNQRLSFIFGRAERAPEAQELLSDGEHVATSAYEVGDADLDTEESFNAEVTWGLDTKRASARASIFYSDFSGYIFLSDTETRFSSDLEESGQTGLGVCSNNLDDFGGDQDAFDDAIGCFEYVQEGAVFAGIEAEVTVRYAPHQSLRLWGDFVNAELDDNGDVPRIPPGRIGASWDYQRQAWTAGLSLTKAFDQNNPGEGQEETDGYLRVDAELGWGFDNYSIFVKGTNLGDREIRNSTSFLREIAPEPGRAFTLGAVYRF